MSNINLYLEKLSEEDARHIEKIEAEADKTPAKDKGLAIHVLAIEKLRAKGYSYRDIAAWFNERGFKVSHVDVWRAHRNSLDAEDYLGLADHDDEWQEFVNKKVEGNVIRYEDAVPEPQITPEETKEGQAVGASKKQGKRSRKSTKKQ